MPTSGSGTRLGNTSVYVYYVTSDGGDAPCHQNNVTTLCTCKPAIRRTANVGDIVVGLVSRALLEHSNARPRSRGSVIHAKGDLLWMGRVSRVVNMAWYGEHHRSRRDCLYRIDPDVMTVHQVPNPYHGIGDARNDISGHNVLFLSGVERFSRVSVGGLRLLGNKALNQGHIRNDVADVEAERTLARYSRVSDRAAGLRSVQLGSYDVKQNARVVAFGYGSLFVGGSGGKVAGPPALGKDVVMASGQSSGPGLPDVHAQVSGSPDVAGSVSQGSAGQGADQGSVDQVADQGADQGAYQGAAGQGAAGQDAAGQDAAGQDAAGQDAAGQDAAGQDAAGQDAAGQDAAGQDAAGQDAAGQDAAGQGAHRQSPSPAASEQAGPSGARKKGASAHRSPSAQSKSPAQGDGAGPSAPSTSPKDKSKKPASKEVSPTSDILGIEDNPLPFRHDPFEIRAIQSGNAFTKEFMEKVFADALFSRLPPVPTQARKHKRTRLPPFTVDEFNDMSTSLKDVRTVTAFMGMINQIKRGVSQGLHRAIAYGHHALEIQLSRLLRWGAFTDQVQFKLFFRQFAMYPIITAEMQTDTVESGQLGHQLKQHAESKRLYTTHFTGGVHYIAAEFNADTGQITAYDSMDSTLQSTSGNDQMVKLAKRWKPDQPDPTGTGAWKVVRARSAEQTANDCALYSLWNMMHLAIEGVIPIDQIHSDAKLRGRAMRCVLVAALFSGSMEFVLDPNVVRAVARTGCTI